MTGNDFLFQAWLNHKHQMNQEARYVWNQAQFDAVDADSVDYLLGIELI